MEASCQLACVIGYTSLIITPVVGYEMVFQMVRPIGARTVKMHWGERFVKTLPDGSSTGCRLAMK
jgi:hypothetical protein